MNLTPEKASSEKWYRSMLELYEDVVGTQFVRPMQLMNEQLIEAFMDSPSVMSVQQFREFWRSKKGTDLAERVRNRSINMFLFQQPMVIAIYPALAEAPMEVKRQWPFECLKDELEKAAQDVIGEKEATH